MAIAIDGKSLTICRERKQNKKHEPMHNTDKKANY